MSGTQISSRPGGPPSGVIVTAAGHGMHEVLHDLALPTFHQYARAWNWQVEAHDLGADGSGADAGAVQAKWAKIPLLREALTRHRFALWLDADVLLLRRDEDVRDHLHPGSFQGLVLEQVPADHRINPNTGVWLLRSCPAAFAFLDAVEDHGLQPGPWADQGAVLAALAWDRGDEQYRWARPGPGNAFTAATSWLPPGWNQPYIGPRPQEDLYGGTAAYYADRPGISRPHALHFMGMLAAGRHREMARTLSEQPASSEDPLTVTA